MANYDSEQHLDKEEAQELFDDAFKRIGVWGTETSYIKLCMYKLCFGNAYIALGCKTHEVLFKALFRESGLHRTTLNNYKNAVILEVELGLEHNLVSTDALVELKKNTNRIGRKKIWEIAKELCEDEKIPTKGLIRQAKLKFEEEEEERKNDDDDDDFFDKLEEVKFEKIELEEEYDEGKYIGEVKDEEDKGKVEDNKKMRYSMTLKQAYELTKDYEQQDYARLLKRIYLKKHSVAFDAAKIIRFMSNDDFLTFRREIKKKYGAVEGE
ncbi:MAG: hypothetical protein D4R63_12240 [Methylococcaceae bacterium]|nr:MAG: hypothetical protein D4R63_12240 [Methylococcaceae bacterium]